jgi:SAM-dependent methyltransferase
VTVALAQNGIHGGNMTITLEWATYPRLLERDFFERTMALYFLEKELQTPIPDSMHWTRRFEYPWVMSKLGTMTNILDVGAGSTALQFLAARRGVQVTSIDPDPNAINWVNSRTNTLVKNPKCIPGCLPNLPFSTGEFDTVICISVLEHLPKSQILQSIQELIRVSRKEVLITMDICMQEQPNQIDLGGFEKLMKELNVNMQIPGSNAMNFSIDNHNFTVICIHITRS